MRQKLKIIALTCMLVVTEVAFPDSIPDGGPYAEIVGGIEWTFMVTNGAASVGTGSQTAIAIPYSTSGDVAIPESLGGCPVRNISVAAFKFCSKLTSVTIPNGITNIGASAFSFCAKLETVSIPSTVLSVGNAFSYSENLETISVDVDNPSYSSKSGLLCSKDGSRIIEGVNGDVTIPNGVTSIGSYAFSGRKGLKTLSIPSSVTSIGYSAFGGCGGLISVTVDGDNEYYKSDNAMLLTKDGETLVLGVNGEVTIPPGVKEIGLSAFCNCSGLTRVTIPPSVTSIGSHAFDSCNGLTSITIPSNVTEIGVYAFVGSSSLDAVDFEGAPPAGMSNARINQDATIRYNANYADEWQNVIAACGFTNASPYVPPKSNGGPYTETVDGIVWTFMVINGTASVGTGSQSVGAVSSATSGDIAVPGSLGGCPVVNIGVAAFKFCSKILSVTIPSGVTNIGNFAFSFCDKLQSVSIPASVTDIRSSVFAYSGELLTLTVDENNLSYSLRNGLLCSKDGTSIVVGVGGDIVVPDGVTSIDRSAFTGRSCLRTISLPSSLTSVWYDVFNGCSGLTSICIDGNNQTYKSVNGLLLTKNGETLVRGVNGDVDIPSGVTTIGMDAFCGCKTLTSVKIPAGVTTIKSHAFESCKELTSVTIPSSVTELGTYVFLACNALGSVDFEGAPPIGLANAKINQDAVIRYNADYEDEWLPVIAECGFTHASPYTPPKYDGGPYVETVEGAEWTFVVTNLESVVRGLDDASGCVTIPSTLGGRTVTAIDHSAFLNCGEMTSVTIPASVTEIGSEAFSGCEKLADVWFEGSTIGKIGQHAFLGCYWDLIMHVPAGWQGRGRTIAGYTVWRGGSSDVEKCVNMTVTNVVVQYVLNSIQPEIAVPVSTSVGFVNIITEVASSGAVSVPTEWKDNYQQFEAKFGTDFGKALAMKTGKKDGAGNDMFVWQDFVAGTDPTDENDQFTASITIVDGAPVISYTPELTAEQAALRVYKTYGKMKLTDTAWTDITAKTSEERAAYNFFKVTVEMK